jgi:hypothetical protein
LPGRPARIPLAGISFHVLRWPGEFGSVEEVEGALEAHAYLADRGLATAVYLSLAMRRPLLVEGEPGVGKTEVGRTLARLLGAELIRLQCYEGIDSAQALYEWDYARQLLYARALPAGEVREQCRSCMRAPATSSSDSVWSRVATGSTTVSPSRARSPASRTADLSCAEETGSS